jgi:hypothetical protein
MRRSLLCRFRPSHSALTRFGSTATPERHPRRLIHAREVRGVESDTCAFNWHDGLLPIAVLFDFRPCLATSRGVVR